MGSSAFDTEHTDEMVCPWCGHEQRDSWESPDDDGRTACNRCGEDFDYTRHVTVTYSTSKPEVPS